MSPAKSLEELMESYVDGDARSFNVLYGHLQPPVQASLRKWLRQPHLVDDAQQATFLKLHASRARYRRGAPVLPWVLTIARNVAVDRLRSKSAQEHPLDKEDAEKIPAPFEVDDTDEIIAAVRDAIESLSPALRDAVRLHKIEGKTMAEVAELLGVKEGAARLRAHRGYKVLLERLTNFRARKS